MSKFKQELRFLLDTFSDDELSRLSSGLNRTVKGKKTRENVLKTLLTITGKNSNNNPYITELFRHMNRILKQDLSEVAPETITGFNIEAVHAEDLRFGRTLMCHQDTIIQGKGRQIYNKALSLYFELKGTADASLGNETAGQKVEAEAVVRILEAEAAVQKGEAAAAVEAAAASSLVESAVIDEELVKTLEGRLNELEKRLAEQTNRFISYKEELKEKESIINELEADLKRQKNKFQKEVDQTNKFKREAEEAKEKLKQKMSDAQKDKEEAGHWRHRAAEYERKAEEQETALNKLREEVRAEREKRMIQAQDTGLAGNIIAQALEKARAEAAANEKQAGALKREAETQRPMAAGASGGPKELYFGEDRGSTVLVFADPSPSLEVEFQRREIKVLWADLVDWRRPRQRLAQVQMVLYDEGHPKLSVEVVKQAAEGQNKRCYELKNYLA